MTVFDAFRNVARLAPRVPYRFLLLLILLISFLAAGCTSVFQRPAGAATSGAIAPVREAALPLTGRDEDYDPLMDLVGDARFVLLGDSTHGTHEFYRERARLTERLIREKGFDAVAIEGDWQDAGRVNRYVRGLSGDSSAEQALASFHDFPGWMWANTDVRDLVGWLRQHNASLPAAERAGFYGLDLYGVVSSADALTATLDHEDPRPGTLPASATAAFPATAPISRSTVRTRRCTPPGPARARPSSSCGKSRAGSPPSCPRRTPVAARRCSPRSRTPGWLGTGRLTTV